MYLPEGNISAFLSHSFTLYHSLSFYIYFSFYSIFSFIHITPLLPLNSTTIFISFINIIFGLIIAFHPHCPNSLFFLLPPQIYTMKYPGVVDKVVSSQNLERVIATVICVSVNIVPQNTSKYLPPSLQKRLFYNESLLYSEGEPDIHYSLY